MLDSVITEAQQNVVNLRLLRPTGAITREFKTREDLETITRGFFRRSALRDQVFETEELYTALGLMEEEQDLEDILSAIQTQQVFAVFDDEAEKVYVVSEATNIGPVEELAIALSYMGAMLQQQFDVSNLRRRARDANYDMLRAVDALVVGDVAQVADGYIQRFITPEEYEELTKPLPGDKLLQAPVVVQKANRFPKLEGKNFVAALDAESENPWEGVDAAYRRMPASTEQVMHPEKYLADEQPRFTAVPNIADDLGKAWVEVSSNTMGEFLLRTYLEQHLAANQAADAAAGWGGDRYSLLTGPAGERLLLVFITWDSFQEAAQFYNTYQVFVGVKMRATGATSETVGESGRKWVTPEEAIFVGQIGPAILLIIGPDENIVGTALQLLFEALGSRAP